MALFERLLSLHYSTRVKFLGRLQSNSGKRRIGAAAGPAKGLNMSNLRRTLFLSVPLLCLAASSAYGQATRTWISGVGDDVNPCSRTAPCKTFAGAISKTAANGEISVLDPGGFGAVTITKSISLEADGVVAGILSPGTNGVVINAGANDVVVLRGLTFEGVGTGLNGVQIISAGKVVIENCFFRGYTPRGISVEPTANNVQVVVSNTTLQENASNGIVVRPANGTLANVTLDNVRIVNNVNHGLIVSPGGTVVVRNSSIANNAVGTAFANIRAEGPGVTTNLLLDNVSVSGGPTGILAVNGAAVRVNSSSIFGNTLGLSATGAAQILSYGNNRLGANGTDGAFSSVISLQ